MERARMQGGDAAKRRDGCDRLLLAAVRRAVLHEGSTGRAVAFRSVLSHLAISPRSAQARALRARLDHLRGSNLVTQARAHGVVVWGLAAGGTRLLAAAEADGWQADLPEAPQHRAWRAAREAAAQSLGLFAAELREDVREASALLDALSDGDAPPSEEWLALGPRLLGDCRRLGSALHCLREWPEPSDEVADRDPAGVDPLRAGRRNIALWERRP